MAQPSPELRAERQRLRRARRAVRGTNRTQAETAVQRTLLQLGVAGPGQRVATYLAMPGELNVDSFVKAAIDRRALVYAPKIISMRRRRMVFVPLSGARLHANPYGIDEPAAAPGQYVPILRLDTVIVPMLGFDRCGNRLGMGAGFYDRALRIRRAPGRSWRRPRLIGVAFACQEVVSITPSRWDVAMDLIVTEREIIKPIRSTKPEEVEQ